MFAFASDPRNLPLYEKGILSAKMVTEGQVEAGTTFQLVARQLGMRMIATMIITTYEPDQYFSWKVISGPFPVETHYALHGLEEGTSIRAVREPQPRGMWTWLIPLVTSPARKKLLAELQGLKDYLETDSWNP